MGCQIGGDIQPSTGAVMSDAVTIGIDLAKNVFSIHAVAADGRVLMRRQVSRAKLMETVANFPQALIGMEACAGSHEWADRFGQLGHTVRLMAPKLVAPYRKGGKNDGNDAEAICEAVCRPSMRFVPIKSAEQRAMLTLHRARQSFVVERTATVNRIRALLTEFGLVLSQGTTSVRRGVPTCVEALPSMAQRAARDLYEHLKILDARITEYDRDLTCQRRVKASHIWRT
jgi:transposase